MAIPVNSEEFIRELQLAEDEFNMEQARVEAYIEAAIEADIESDTVADIEENIEEEEY